MLAGSTERWSLFFTYPLRAASLLTLVDCLWQFCHQRVIAQDFQFQAYFRKTFCFVFCLFNTLLPGDDSVPMYSRAVRKMVVPWLVHYNICTWYQYLSPSTLAGTSSRPPPLAQSLTVFWDERKMTGFFNGKVKVFKSMARNHATRRKRETVVIHPIEQREMRIKSEFCFTAKVAFLVVS